MASDPFSSLVLLIFFMFAGAYLRAAEAAARLVDETAFPKDSPAARFVSACDNRFGAPERRLRPFVAGRLRLRLLRLFRAARPVAGRRVPCGVFRRAALGRASVAGDRRLYIAVCALLPAYVAARAPEKTLRAHAGAGRTSCFRWPSPSCCFAKGLATLHPQALRHVPVTALGERVTNQEIRMMVDIGEEKGEIEADEKQMIENVFEFNNMTAEECMVHRKDVTAIDVEDDPAAILQTIQDSGLSRFPVYEEDVDNILGILTSRDYLLNDCFERGKTLRELIRPAYFVPESLRADLLFSEMQKRKQHMAIVVDEYGGTSGIVTLEDLLEEIVGNIYDEFDPQADEDIIPLSDTRLRVSGSARLDALGESWAWSLARTRTATRSAAWCFPSFPEIPSDGERPVVTCRGLRIAVEQISDRRVEWAIVEKLPPEDNAGAEGTENAPAK